MNFVRLILVGWYVETLGGKFRLEGRIGSWHVLLSPQSLNQPQLRPLPTLILLQTIISATLPVSVQCLGATSMHKESLAIYVGCSEVQTCAEASVVMP